VADILLQIELQLVRVETPARPKREVGEEGPHRRHPLRLLMLETVVFRFF
jgi:hypothetical protein